MTFLQPFVLFGLPLILLPVVIHLINRRRYRTQSWAAMRFLVTATRSSVSQAKLRQFLILLLRVLAVLMLILFLSRPLVGGWVGWAFSPAPDAIVLLLDRSASMEARIEGTDETKRERALSLLSEAARDFASQSHLVLIDSASLKAQNLGSASDWESLSVTGPTDTAADIPSMFQTAVDWLVDNQSGTAEIWIASDLQAGNWKPQSDRWSQVVTELESLPADVRVRLLGLTRMPEGNAAISLDQATRRQGPAKEVLDLVLNIRRNDLDGEALPMTLTLNGSRSQKKVPMEGQSMRWRLQETIDSTKKGGWGKFQLPPDSNLRDNQAYFAYGRKVPLKATVVTTGGTEARYLRSAAGAFSNRPMEMTQQLSPDEVGSTDWRNHSLIIWQAPLPVGAMSGQLEAFAEQGGVVVFFPSGSPTAADSQRVAGLKWGAIEEPTDKAFRIEQWNETEGPLTQTEAGTSLPVDALWIAKRQRIVGDANRLAHFQDGQAFLARRPVGDGEIYFCGSLPGSEWSNLGEGWILVPMLQRMLQDGSQRLRTAKQIVCGELSAADRRRQWESIDSEKPKDIETQAGVYRAGDRRLAVNRPAGEDRYKIIPPREVESLFGSISFQMLQEENPERQSLQGEIWRALVLVMLLGLFAEGLLTLPRSA